VRTIALILLALAAPARAEPAEVTVAIRWTSRDGCLDGEALRAAVSGRTRRRPVLGAAGADAIITGRAAAAGSGWQVELVVTDRGGAILGRRDFTVPEPGCAALRDHVGLVVSMLVDSSVVERATAPSGARWRADLGLAAVAEAGRLPSVRPGLSAAIGLRAPGGWRIELAAAGFARAEAEAAGGSTSLTWRAGAVTGCIPAWRLDACAGLEVGALTGRGSGFVRNQRDRQVLVDGLAGARLDQPLLGPVFLRAGLELRAAAVRPRFGYQDESGVFQALYEPSLLAATARLGLGVHFP
jgi:hypothetical protein